MAGSGKQWLGCLVAAAIMLAVAAPCRALDRMNWSPRNHQVLAQFIQEFLGRGGKLHDPAKPPYAVFDWDQTSAFLDCGEATFRYQLTHLKLKLDKAQFRALLKDEINGTQALSAEFKGIKLADLDADLAADYDFLHDNVAGLGGSKPLEEVQASPQFRDFITKMGFLYDGYCETAGIGTEYGYPWVLFLLAGFTPDEVKALAQSVIDANLADALASVTWKGPADFKSKVGPVDYTFKSGLRVHPEMQDLMESLRTAGIDVYVVTASLKQEVEVFAGRCGYNVPADHVIGMEVAVQDGKLQPAYKTGWVQTQRAGKVAAIREKLGQLGDPIFGACDSDGDVDMVTQFAGMKLTVILNRVKGGEIGKLCRQAVAEQDKPAPRYLLQGRNENTGLFIPTSETISLGQTLPKLLK